MLHDFSNIKYILWTIILSAITTTSKLSSILNNYEYNYTNHYNNDNTNFGYNYSTTKDTNDFNRSNLNNNLRSRNLTTVNSPNPSVNTGATTKIKIILSSSNKCVTTAATLEDFSYLSLSDCSDNSLSQKFDLNSFDSSSTALKIQSNNNKSYLITESSLSATASSVQIFSFQGNTTDNQKFYFIKNPGSQNNDFFISSVTTRKCIESIKNVDGTFGLVMNTCESINMAANQLFYISQKCEGNLYLEDDKCVSQCKFGNFPNEVEKTCAKCTLFINKNVNPQVCISNCGVNVKSDLESGLNICRPCSDDLFFFTNKCVKKCDKGYIYDMKKNCVACPSLDNFNYDYKCVDDCPKYTAKDIIEKTCTNCNKLSPPKKWYKGTCQDNVSFISTLINAEFNAFEDCGANGKSYYHNNICLDKCPPQTTVYSGQSICYDYIEMKKFNFNDVIVDNCPPSYIANEYSRCVPCKYNKEKVCLVNCPLNQALDSNNVCYDCRDTNKYYYNNLCYDSCPFPYSEDTYTYYNTTSRMCNNCRDDKKYILKESNSCSTSCQSGYLPHPVTSICLSCNEFGKVVYNGQCALVCPQGTTINIVTNTCLDSLQSSRIVNTTTLSPDYIKTLCVKNSCLNNGSCYVENYKENCKCQSGYMGGLCEYSDSQYAYLVTKNAINGITYDSTNTITSIDLTSLINMQLLVQQNSTFVTPHLQNSLYNYTVIQVNDSINTNKTMTFSNSENLFRLLDATMMIAIKNDTLISSKLAPYSELSNDTINKITVLKQLTTSLLGKMSISDIKGTFINHMFSLQIMSSSDIVAANEEAKQNGLTTFNFEDCEKYLKKYYEIPQSMNLIYYKVDFSSGLSVNKQESIAQLNSADISFGSSTSIKLFNPITKKELDQKLCKNYNTRVGIPIAVRTAIQIQNVKQILLTNDFTSNGQFSEVDVSDGNSAFFNNYCVTLVDKYGNYITLNQRRSLLYPNVTTTCKENCIYKGLDIFNYAICECAASKHEDIGNIFTQASLNEISNVNVDIWYCEMETYILPKLVTDNTGFHIIIGTIATFIVTFIIAAVIRLKMLENDWEKIFYNDCLIIDEMLKNKEVNEKFEDLNEYMRTKYIGTENNENEIADIDKLDSNRIGEILVKDVEQIEPLELVDQKERQIKESSSESIPHEPHKNIPEEKTSQEKISDPEGVHEDKIDTLERFKENSKEEPAIESDDNIIVEVNGAATRRRESKKTTTSLIEVNFETGPQVIPTVKRGVSDLLELKEKLNFDLTKQDYKKTPYKGKLLLDHRSFCQYYWDMVQDSSLIVSIFWKRTILKPYYISIVEFFHKFVLSLGINALFMSDDLITNGNKTENKDMVFI